MSEEESVLHENYKLTKENQQLKEQIENIKVCGNCYKFDTFKKVDRKISRSDCPNLKTNLYHYDNYCDKWISDNMTKKQRTK